MIFTLGSFSLVVANFCSVRIFGVSAIQASAVTSSSPKHIIQATQLIQAISSLLMFLGSAILYAYLSHPEPFRYLGLRKITNKIQLLIIPALMIAVIPLLTQLGSWMEALPLGKEALANKKLHADTMEALMQMDHPGALLVNICLFALLPALGEELLFRGVILRLTFNSTRNIHFAIFISAAIFSMAHADVYNFLPIMLAGVLLGYIYYLTGSIWLSILAHFLNNGLQIAALYLSQHQAVAAEAGKLEQYPWYIIAGSVLLSVAVLFWLHRKATPLPEGWSNDF